MAFCCPYCQTTEIPRTESKVSTGGWVVFVVLLISCFPVCWIGLLMKEDTKICRGCGIKLG